MSNNNYAPPAYRHLEAFSADLQSYVDRLRSADYAPEEATTVADALELLGLHLQDTIDDLRYLQWADPIACPTGADRVRSLRAFLRRRG